MIKYSAPNERIKREYFNWLKEAKGRNEASIDGIAKALRRFEIPDFATSSSFISNRPEASRPILPSKGTSEPASH